MNKFIPTEDSAIYIAVDTIEAIYTAKGSPCVQVGEDAYTISVETWRELIEPADKEVAIVLQKDLNRVVIPLLSILSYEYTEEFVGDDETKDVSATLTLTNGDKLNLNDYDSITTGREVDMRSYDSLAMLLGDYII